MAQLFARVELRGTPDLDAYEMLHAHMSSRYWHRTIQGTIACKLPQATYQATTYGDHPDIMTMANELKRSIEQSVWAKAMVLIIQSTNWAEAG
jgi:hypothetical protein